MLLYLFNLFFFFMEVGQLVYNIGAVFWRNIYKLFKDLPKKSVANKIILITGAGSGVGREMAIRFAKLNAILVLWDINSVSARPALVCANS